MTICPLSVQLYTFREAMAGDPAAVFSRLVELGFVGVEPVCPTGMPEEFALRNGYSEWTVGATELKHILDAQGLVISSAHTALPEAHNANAVLDEQELLGNDLLIIPALSVLPGGKFDDLDTLDTLKRAADRFNNAASLAADRRMRVGYHNHFWEWNGTIADRTGWDVFWRYLEPSVVAEVDIYWAQVAGQDPATVIAELGPRVQLAHVKDGPLIRGEPMTLLGTGKVDVSGALAAGEHLRWHVIEFDECATDIFEAVGKSAAWLVDHGLSTAR